MLFTVFTMGERFAVLVQYFRMVTRNRPMLREEEQAQDYIAKVTDAGRRAIAAGAEVVFLTGSTAAFLASRNVFAIDDVPLLHSYGLLVKAAEAAVAMHRVTGHCVSRRNYYQSPLVDLMDCVATTRNLPMFRPVPVKSGSEI